MRIHFWPFTQVLQKNRREVMRKLVEVVLLLHQNRTDGGSYDVGEASFNSQKPARVYFCFSSQSFWKAGSVGFLRCLEFLDNAAVHELPQVIIEAARIADGVAKLE